MPLPVVPATFQVTFCDDPPTQETAVLGAVTANAAPVFTTTYVTSSVVTPPPPRRLSRAITRHLNAVRATAGSFSPTANVLFTRFDSRGTVRCGLVVGDQSRMIGLVPLSAVESDCAPPRSRSCQSNVSSSPSGSE